jgi:hypothetical protein
MAAPIKPYLGIKRKFKAILTIAETPVKRGSNNCLFVAIKIALFMTPTNTKISAQIKTDNALLEDRNFAP